MNNVTAMKDDKRTVFNGIEYEYSKNAKVQSFRIAFINFAVGCLWILLSDKLVQYLIKDMATATYINIIKGWFYVLITSLLIFLFILSALKKVIESNDKMAKMNAELEKIVFARTSELQETNLELADTVTFLNEEVEERKKVVGEIKILNLHLEKKVAERTNKLEKTNAELEETNAELQKTKEQLLEAQEFAHLGYWEFEATSGKVSWSDELFRIYGFEPQEFEPTFKDFINLIHPNDKEFMMDVLNQPLKGNEYELDLRINRQDSETIWIHKKVKSEYDASDNLVRIYGVVHDITKMKEYEEVTLKNRMEKEMARLDKLSLVGAVAAGIGHEVRNPMTTVRGYLQLFSNKEEFMKYNSQLALMIDELDRANSIITEFLSLAKDRVVELKVQSLKEIVLNIFPLIQADGLITDKYIHLELDEVAEIPLDRKEIHQLILNLVLNGSQAMPPGGTMKIRTFMDGDEVVLSVTDDGTGIEPEVLGKIGTPFFTTKENGTGLGLAVCYSIAVRHNAKIDIETNSSGTTFFVRFR